MQRNMKFKLLIAMVATLLLATGCQGQNKQEVKPARPQGATLNTDEINQISEKSKKSNAMNKIVIFFSHAGDNYSVGNIEVGCYGPRA